MKRLSKEGNGETERHSAPTINVYTSTSIILIVLSKRPFIRRDTTVPATLSGGCLPDQAKRSGYKFVLYS